MSKILTEKRIAGKKTGGKKAKIGSTVAGNHPSTEIPARR